MVFAVNLRPSIRANSRHKIAILHNHKSFSHEKIVCIVSTGSCSNFLR
jgi:hypothetical protein